ncbi:hypothetical protein C0989_009881 [Termitomyces sp. Mn162]|nr:hypothetical protein C0989_009881 [Termitomyces sp. Mn162]
MSSSSGSTGSAVDSGGRDWIEISITLSPGAPVFTKYSVFDALAPGSSNPKGTPLMKLEERSSPKIITNSTDDGQESNLNEDEISRSTGKNREVGNWEDILPEKMKQPPLSQHSVAVISSSRSVEDGICPTSMKENEEGFGTFECRCRTINGEVVWEKCIDNDDIGREDMDMAFGATSDS